MIELIEAKSAKSQITCSFKIPTIRYFDEFMGLTCAPDLLAWKLFPNAKEITESMAAYRAVQKYLWEWFPPGDSQVDCYVVGDGRTPRTGALFALRTAWQVYSIDPNLAGDWSQIRRLTIVPKKIEDTAIDSPTRAVIVHVHSHAKISDSLDRIRPIGHLAVVAMPCCVDQSIGTHPPDVEYQDWGIWSPQRTMKVWKLA